jgi:hypothetical protein
MKYMTHDLFVRMQSENGEVAEAALDQWERACEDYNRHVEAIRAKLPRSVQSLLDSFSLHDAEFAAFGVGRDDESRKSVFIGLQLDSPSNQVLGLSYKLAGPMKMIFHVPNPQGDVDLLWLYDEFDVAEVNLPEGGRVSVFTHSLLLSEGVELQIPFYDLSMFRYKNFLTPAKGFRLDVQAGQEELQVM